MLLTAIRRSPKALLLLSCVTLLLSACGGGGSGPPSTPGYSVGGSVSGLSGGSVVLTNGGSTVSVSANGTFRFPAAVSANSSYSVSVSSQPQGQVCTVSNGSGTAATDVTNVSVTCLSSSFNLAGRISGLSRGQQVELSNNGADALTLSNNGAFFFSAPVAANGTYSITVTTQPTGAVCTVSNGTGAGVTANVSDVRVTCSTYTYTIAGNVAGLPPGTSLELRNNAADPVTVSADGTFTFAMPVAYDGSYLVTVSQQPAASTCTVSNGSGAGVTADVSNVSVACSTSTYAVGGMISGLTPGLQVTLNDNGADPLTLNANGTFTFPTRVAHQGSYLVTVGTQPTGQTCTVTQGSGSSVTADASSVAVICSTNVYTIGGTLSGLAAGVQVTLRNNGTNPLTLTSNGTFQFATPIAHGGSYSATVGTFPGGQFCAVSNGFATPVTGNVSNISVQCFDSPVVFSTPGIYNWTVPAGVTSIRIVALGGGGGGGGNSSLVLTGARGGAGAVVTVTRTVTPGQMIWISIGGGGGAGTDTPFQGGGAYACASAGGGGGSTAVDPGTASQIIAGGGGSGGACGGTDGGSGGGAGGVGGDGIANAFPGGRGGSGDGHGGSAVGPGTPGNGGTGGRGGNAASTGGNPGGTGGVGAGLGRGGSTILPSTGVGGGGYGGGGSGGSGFTGGGAGGSTGPAGTVYAPGSNGGSESSNGGNGLVVITAQ